MFTKYQGVAIPKNYSGVRFKDGSVETEMKTHRGQITPSQDNIKSCAASPTFQSIIDSVASDEVDDLKNDEVQASDFDEQIASDEAGEQLNTVKCEEEEKPCISSQPLGFLDNTLKGLLDGIGGDDLLLLCLLLLIATDRQENSIDGIIILALLLLYH